MSVRHTLPMQGISTGRSDAKICRGLRLEGRVLVTIKVIVELRAHPGQRDELRAVFEHMLAVHGSDLPGFLGSSRYEKLGDPDVLVEIAEWESAEARDVHMKEAAASGTHAPLLDMVAEPFRVEVLRSLA